MSEQTDLSVIPKEWSFEEWAESEGWSRDECPESWAQGEQIWQAAWTAHYMHSLALKPSSEPEEKEN